ncbi:Uncharacterised protein [Bacillus licheniformis]|nr:hypothetical protein CPQ91_17345 [Bacillus licheniformis]KJE29490.1 hypothetical protein LG49_227 [Bacillus licheniformis]KJH54417.1 hypothetical protein UF14_17960 [Bacillus licheniformis]OAZ62668.1 hypothetical protein SRCM100115_03409 [Bacillus licheniformis]OLO20609.1 hypothetical protein BKP29_0200460 [Bacillus licheniformis]
MNTSFQFLRVKLRFLRCKAKGWFFIRAEMRVGLLRVFRWRIPDLRSVNTQVFLFLASYYFRLKVAKRTKHN